MHHPGPPRFVTVGDTVELAPRDPDPAATFAWRVARAPDASTATVGDDPVEAFVPDVPGRYRIELSAPDGTHGLTVRAFDEEPSTSGPRSGSSGEETDAGPASAETDEDGTVDPETDDDETTDPEADDDGTTDPGTDDGRTTDPDPGGRPRIELSTTTTPETVAVRATPRPNPAGEETAADLDVAFVLDDRDELDRSDVTVDGRELSIPRDRLPGRARVHAVAVGRGGYSVPDVVAVERERTGSEGSGTDAGLRTTRPYDPPDWAEDAVIYEVNVRNFPGQTGDWNGDPATGRSAFDAIVDRLDYIEDLGVDALWLTPVLENDHAPHGYNVTDFFAIASDLGTRDDYERLIEAAHDRGIRVLFDFVANHSARDHPYFQAAVADPDSEYREWYEWRGPTEPETYFEWEYIANFDFTHLPVRQHLLDAVDEWSELVDGFRCDMAWAVPDGFWREVHDRLKARDEAFLLLDETIPYIPEFQAGLFDVHFDSTTYAALRRIGRDGEPADVVLDAVEERGRIGFPDFAGFMLYAENHDETRYVVECGRPAARAALGALFTLPGAPMVYAGQEFGQRGQRDDLAWDHADDELRHHVERLAAARTREPPLAADAALRRVPYDVRDGDAGPVVAFARVAGDETDADARVVVLNFGAGTATVAVEAPTGDTDVVTGAAVTTEDGIEVDDVVVLAAESIPEG